MAIPWPFHSCRVPLPTPLLSPFHMCRAPLPTPHLSPAFHVCRVPLMTPHLSQRGGGARSLARSLARFPYMPSSVADFAPLSNFPYVPSSIADSAPLSIPYVPSSVADSALLSGSDPELSSSSSGGSDAHRAQAVLTDSDTFASPRSVVLSLQRMRRRE